MVRDNFVIRTRRRLPVFFFALLHSAARLTAQDSFISCSVLDQSISFAQVGEQDSKNNASNDPAQDFKPQNWSFHVQATEIGMGQPGFRSPYKGTNSIAPDDDFRQTSNFNIFLGARLWPGGEVYFDGGYYQGFGFGDTHGIAAFPNAEGSNYATTPNFSMSSCVGADFDRSPACLRQVTLNCNRSGVIRPMLPNTLRIFGVRIILRDELVSEATRREMAFYAAGLPCRAP